MTKLTTNTFEDLNNLFKQEKENLTEDRDRPVLDKLGYMDEDQDCLDALPQGKWLTRTGQGTGQIGIITQPIAMVNTHFDAMLIERLGEIGINIKWLYKQMTMIDNATLIGIDNVQFRVLINQLAKSGDIIYDVATRDISEYKKPFINGAMVKQLRDPEMDEKNATEEDWQWLVHPALCTAMNMPYSKILWEQEQKVITFLQKGYAQILKGFTIVTGFTGQHSGFRYALLMPNLFIDLAPDRPSEIKLHDWLNSPESMAKKVNIWEVKRHFKLGKFDFLTTEGLH